MSERQFVPVGDPCWVDLLTSDTDQAEAFYGELFGWKAESAGEEYGGYINFSKDGVRVAGCMGNAPESGIPDLWTVYLATDDAQKTVDAAAANGGQVALAPMAVGELGTMGMVIDPGGAGIGLWQPGLHRGFGLVGEPGTPNWFELHTREYDATVQFYRDVFTWDTHVASDEPDFRYTTLGEGDDALAGVMDATAMLPEGAPATWSVYFGVEDSDAALAKIVDLGGAVVVPAEDTPYGRLSQAADPTGALFKLITP